MEREANRPISRNVMCRDLVFLIVETDVLIA